MCLYLKDKKPKIAKRNIVCYKILNRTRRFNWTTDRVEKAYTTPYQHTPINLVNDDIIEGIRCFEPDSSTSDISPISPNLDFLHTEGWKWVMHGGCIHSYRYKKDANFMWSDAGQVIFKCIIPKGTEYYEGIDGIHQKNYASKKIRFVKQIK